MKKTQKELDNMTVVSISALRDGLYDSNTGKYYNLEGEEIPIPPSIPILSKEELRILYKTAEHMIDTYDSGEFEDYKDELGFTKNELEAVMKKIK